jgi:wyosine [tRNA(Phe)-imidazoG37] synthetase (radical SAM superfamily)
MSELHRFNALKILAYADRLRAVARDEMPFPIDWHVYPSNKCNHSCEFCLFIQNGEQDNAAQLTRTQLLQYVEDAARLDGVLVHFSGGGEPLLNKYTLEAMQLAKARGLAVALSTNGRLLTPEVARTVDFIRVSLNAGTQATHDRVNHHFRPGSDWQKILDAIRDSAPHKLRDLGLAFVVTPQNADEIYLFCQTAADVGADFVHIRPGFYYDAERDTATRSAMQLAFTESEAARRDFGDRLRIFAISDRFDGYWTPRTYSACKAVWTGVLLTATGELAVCQDRTDLRFGYGYKMGETFEAIWRGDEHRRLVASIAVGGELDKCPRCVWNKRNEIIDQVFGPEDAMRLELP